MEGRRRAAWVVVGLALVVLVAGVGPQLDDPFGESHDGRNSATWALSARAVLEDGPAQSQLGAQLADGNVYAHHPPLIIAATTITTGVGGDDEVAVRLPALLATAAALVLLFLLLDEAGLDVLAAAGGTLVAAATGMAQVYGGMLDTPVISLPFGLAVLWAWQRAEHGRALPPRVVGAIAGAAVLAGWQDWLLLALVLLACTVRRDGSLRRTVVVPLVVGAGVGALLLVVWLVQATGGLSDILDQAGGRASGSAVSPFETVQRQRRWVGDLYGVSVISFVAAVAAVSDPRRRRLALVLLGTVVGYAAIMRGGAAHHDFWTFWGIALVGFGSAWALDRFGRDEQLSVRTRMVVGAVGVTAVVLVSLASTPDAAQQIDAGEQAGHVLRTLEQPHQQLAIVGETGEPSRWIAYYADAPHLRVDDEAELEALPDSTPVLIGPRCADGDGGDLCRDVRDRTPSAPSPGRYGLVVAADIPST